MEQVAEIKLSYSTNVKASSRPQVKCSADTFRILVQSWDASQIEFREEFKALLLNRANRVLGLVNISTGGVAGTVADPKLIFSAAIKANASSIILAHNHPSGNLKPSQADLHLTNKCTQAGKLLDISILDHLIITAEGYYSLADHGQI